MYSPTLSNLRNLIELPYFLSPKDRKILESFEEMDLISQEVYLEEPSINVKIYLELANEGFMKK